MAKRDVQQGTLALMVLKTLEVLGPLHGYGIARRIEQLSGDLLAVNQGTLYPVLLKLEQEGAIASERGTSENNRRARFIGSPPPAAADSAWRRRTGSRQRPLWIASSW
jgi:DNA-binding PadR family transcriptional regulator